jgi:hypothetical protein
MPSMVPSIASAPVLLNRCIVYAPRAHCHRLLPSDVDEGSRVARESMTGGLNEDASMVDRAVSPQKLLFCRHVTG